MNFFSMELCNDCVKRDSLGWNSFEELNEGKERACSQCGSRFKGPHFQLRVLQGHLREPLNPRGLEMKSCQWSDLPAECLQLVLARLSLGSRIRFSGVCKAWQAFFASSTFKRMRESVERPAPPVCMLQHNPGSLYRFEPYPQGVSSGARDLERVEIDLSFLPPKFQAFNFRQFVVHNGLVCIFKVDRREPEGTRVDTELFQSLQMHLQDTDEDDEDEEAEQEREDGGEQRDYEEDEVRDLEGYFTAEDEEVYLMVEEDGEGYSMAEDVERFFMAEDEDFDLEYEDEDEIEDYDEDDDDFNIYNPPVMRRREDGVGMSFCVVNPVMRTFKELPREFGEDEDYFDHLYGWVVQLEVDESGHYRVMVLCTRKDVPTVTIYRSTDNSWESTALSFPFWISGNYNPREPWPQYVLCNDELCTAGNNYNVKIHDLKSGQLVWDRDLVGAHENVEPRQICNVFAWRGKIFCLEQDLECKDMDFGIWEIERSPFAWRKVSVLPEHLQEMLMNREVPETLMGRGYFRFSRPLLTLDGASLIVDTLYVSIRRSFDPYGGSEDLVGFNMLDNTWNVICEDLGTSVLSHVSHLYFPNDFDV